MSPGDAAVAEALFLEGKRLLADGKVDQACPKLAESHRVDPGSGTLLLLGVCLERQGKVASAWATFSSALALSRREHDEGREAIAQRHLERLAPRLPHLVVRVGHEQEQPPEGLEVRKDGLLLSAPSFNTPLPVDPGTHVVTALLHGKPLVERSVSVDEGASVEVQIELPASPTPPRAAPSHGASSAPAPSSAAPPPPAPPSRFAPIFMGSMGVAMLTVGASFGLSAYLDMRRVRELCPQSRCDDPRARSLNDDARTSADVATATLAVGGVLVAASALWLLLEGPQRPPQAARVSSPLLFAY